MEKGWDGFEFGDHYDKMGIRSSATAELIFNDVKVPKENLLGREGQGFKIAMSTLDGGRIGIAAQALGIAQGAYEQALKYAKERIQFGEPIGAQQGISFKLAEMATKIRCARFLVYSAAELKENHQPIQLNQPWQRCTLQRRRWMFPNNALQIFGGTGYLKGMDVERMYRDARITTIYEGTSEIQRVVIAAGILGKLSRASREGAKPGQKQLKKSAPVTGLRKQMIFTEGDMKEKVGNLVEALKKDGHDFSVGIDINTPILTLRE